MLANEKWSEKKATEPSLDGLIAWLETKNPYEGYNFWDPKTCLLAQYAGGHYAMALGRPNSITLGLISAGTPWTMGGALRRARAKKYPGVRGWFHRLWNGWL